MTRPSDIPSAEAEAVRKENSALVAEAALARATSSNRDTLERQATLARADATAARDHAEALKARREATQNPTNTSAQQSATLAQARADASDAEFDAVRTEQLATTAEATAAQTSATDAQRTAATTARSAADLASSRQDAAQAKLRKVTADQARAEANALKAAAAAGGSSTGLAQTDAANAELQAYEQEVNLNLTQSGKNLLLEVPDWDESSENGAQVSYLRLGKVAPEDMSKKHRGADLLAALTTVGPGEGWDSAETPGPRGFEDDWRTRDDTDTNSHQLTQVQRKSRTQELLNAETPTAGWRDHTEGDRISTTRGDKVEVIGGNYKLVVLGRNPDPGNAAGFDLSGGLIQDFDAAPGTINEIRWVQDYDGTWKIFEKTEKGDLYNLFHGDVTEEYYGKNLKTTIGTESGGQSGPGDTRAAMTVDATLQRDNPTIIEKTWAKSIESRTGSGTTPVPTITESVHATTLSTSTAVTSLTDSTSATSADSSMTVSGTLNDTVKAGTLNETVTVAGTLIATTTATALVDNVNYNATWVEAVGGPFHFIFDGSITRTEIIGAALQTNVNVGIVGDIFLGGSFEARLSPNHEFGTLWNTSVITKMESILTSIKTALTSTTTAATQNTTAATSTTQAGAAVLQAPVVQVGTP